MLIKNQIYRTVIQDYTAQGQGVAHVEGCAVFIPDAICGEDCDIQITKAAKTWAAGKIVKIHTVSPHRVNRSCPKGKACGGCAFQHMDYDEECRLKAERVRSAMNRLGGQSLDAVSILPAPDTLAYRNKAVYPVASVKGRAVAGFYKEGTHEVVCCPRCEIMPEEMDLVRDAVTDWMNQFRVSAYDEKTGKGLVRHIFVRRGAVTRQMLVCLTINGRKIPRQDALLDRLVKIPGFVTLVLSVNTKPGNSVLGQEFIPVCGTGWIEDVLCGIAFRLSPRSFYQVNHDQAERLYAMAIEAADLQKTDTVLDLYCGVGTITLAMAGAAGKVIGVELEEQAVADARDNAARNSVDNAEFFCGDAGKAALELESRGLTPDVVVVDPPRKGLSQDVIEAMDKMQPRKIVYVSCDPATLARDVALLEKTGYHLHSCRAADMFPRCSHVETVCLLVLRNPTTHINIDVDVEELVQNKRGQATYPQIKAYVEEHYGFKVSSLYIGQIKTKCGLEKRENYNKGEGKSKDLICPPEKEEAIMDAFRHFGMK